jgi:hypothetical protein
MKLIRIAMIASLAAMTGSAMAATQGTIGVESSGTSDITLAKGNAVQITDVGDITFPDTGNITATATQSDNVCVFSSTGGYSITLSGTGESFVLTSTTATSTIPYSVTWDGVAAISGTPSENHTGNSTSINCNSTTNAQFSVSVTVNDFNGAEPGSYTDTLTLLVRPE